MALPVRTQVITWLLIFGVLTFLLWMVGDVILPFVIGAGIAYFLDPVADSLERMGLTRMASVAVITLVAVLVATVAVLLVVPNLIEQAVALVRIAPKLLGDLQAFLSERFPHLLEPDSPVRNALSTLGQTIETKGGVLIRSAVSSAASLINVLLLMFIAPIVGIYLLYDWDRLVAAVDDLMPRDHVTEIRQIGREIDRTLAGFVRGMGTVSLILGSYYAVALMVAGLQFGLVIGALAGLVTFIPYLGAFIGGVLAIGLALFQFWGDWVQVAIIAGIFVIGQFAEGNFLTPRLVGSSVGLHPVWLIFAISLFGSLFGFVGMLVAVPVTAALGVMLRYLVARYKGSLLYLGTGETGPEQ